jgi:inward rectifier potassium channel
MSVPKLPPSAATRQHQQHRHRQRGSMTVRVGAFELTKKGATRYDWRDPYHIAVSLSWPGFLLMFVVLELAINTIFATLYLLEPGAVANARPGSLTDAFFFSLETLATVGYGVMSPATLYGHIITAIEIIVGMAFVAIMTGLTFVRFSRPRGKFLWADKAVVATYNGQRTLMVRLANGRAGLMVDAHAKMAALISIKTKEGQFFRRVHELPLQRSRLPLFALTWTLMHDLTESSPLHGYDAESYATSQIRLIVQVDANDRALAADVGDVHDYGPEDVLFGMRFADAVTQDAEGRTLADLNLLSALEPDDAGDTTFADANRWVNPPHAEQEAESGD